MKGRLSLCKEKARAIECEMLSRIVQFKDTSRAMARQIEDAPTQYIERLRAAEAEITDGQSRAEANAKLQALLEQCRNEFHALLGEKEHEFLNSIREVLAIIDALKEQLSQCREEFDTIRFEMQDAETDEELLYVEAELNEHLKRCEEAELDIKRATEFWNIHAHQSIRHFKYLIAERQRRCQEELYALEQWVQCQSIRLDERDYDCSMIMREHAPSPPACSIAPERRKPQKASYAPKRKQQPRESRFGSFLGFIRKCVHEPCNEQPTSVNSSIFAPSEAKRGENMMVQVFLYEDGEEQTVADKAAEVDPDAQRRNYTPLSVRLKRGDVVRVSLKMSGEGLKVEDSEQEMIWQGRYTDCQFAVFVDKEYAASTMMGTVLLSVNGVPCGRMMFKTKVEECPQNLYAKIESKSFRKIFISYSSQDESKVKFIALAYKAQGVDYFFDRDYLKAGDVFPEKIREYIDTADLFILCWSKNAAESYYVQQERSRAMSHAYPQKAMDKATLTIHPISIEPRTDFPQDMKEIYNFEVI